MDGASKIQSLGTILGVWAHPDDEVFTCGGVLAIAARNGQRVMCMTATRGERGVQDESRWPQASLKELRTQELNDAYAVLGIETHQWFDLPDGGLHLLDENEGLRMVERCMEQCHADTILTFGPDGLTGHTDHQAVSRWATKFGQERGITVYHVALTPEAFAANKEADEQFNIYFNIDQPAVMPGADCDLFISLDDEILSKKCDALRAMPTQTARMIEAMGEEKFRHMQQIEAFVRA